MGIKGFIKSLFSSDLNELVEYECMGCRTKENIPMGVILSINGIFDRKPKYFPTFLCEVCKKANMVPLKYPFTDDMGTFGVPEK